MKSIKALAVSGLMTFAACVLPGVATAAPAAAIAAAPSPFAVKAAHELLAAMQAEKLMRTVAGSSRYPTEQQRLAVMAKLDKVTPEEVYTRLAAPVAKLVTPETAVEMTRFYQSAYGQKVLKKTYNSGPSLYDEAPKPGAAEKAGLAKPAYIKADKELQAAKPAIRHEIFVLVTELARK